MSSDDPLDAFMSEIEAVVAQQSKESTEHKNDETNVANLEKNKTSDRQRQTNNTRSRINENLTLEDEEESGNGFQRELDANTKLIHVRRGLNVTEETDDEIRAAAKLVTNTEGNSNTWDNPVQTLKRDIDPLDFVDHSSIEYEPFRKTFVNADDYSTLTPAEAAAIRRKISVKVVGPFVPNPIQQFTDIIRDTKLLKAIEKGGYKEPTPIQAQALPTILSGRDMFGIAQTGSGKTLAYGWPMCIHCIAQREIAHQEGPIAIVLVPTRELVQQAYMSIKPFSKTYGMKIVPLYGGASKWEQTKALRIGAEIVISTPARLIDMIQSRATNLRRTTFCVLDEADKMLEMGFERSVLSILRNIRPDRQCVMFSATFRPNVHKLALTCVADDALRVTVGVQGAANLSVQQFPWILASNNEKWSWLGERLEQFCSRGKLLIFVATKAATEMLADSIRAWQNQQSKQQNHRPILASSEEIASQAMPERINTVASLHGDMIQSDRDDVIKSFKKGITQVLIATDVASRGLDIPLVHTVISYDAPKNIDTHIHRVGRTGRLQSAESTDSQATYAYGEAHTLITNDQAWFAGELVKSFERAGISVPSDLLQLALKEPRFRVTRNKDGTPKKGLTSSMNRNVSGISKAGTHIGGNSGAYSLSGIGFDRSSKRSQQNTTRFQAADSGLASVGAFTNNLSVQSNEPKGESGVFSGANSGVAELRNVVRARSAVDFQRSFVRGSASTLQGTIDTSEATNTLSTVPNDGQETRKRRRTRWSTDNSQAATSMPETSNTNNVDTSYVSTPSPGIPMNEAIARAAREARQRALQSGTSYDNGLYVKGMRY